MKFVILLMCSLFGYLNPNNALDKGQENIVEISETSDLSKEAERRLRSEILDFAQKFVGKKYKYAGNGPHGFDCSGYTSFIFHHFNVRLDRSSGMQAKQGKRKRISQLNPADLVFFGNQKKIQHVGIVLEVGKGKLVMVHCSSSKGVVVEDVYRSDYWKDKLLFGKDVIND